MSINFSKTILGVILVILGILGSIWLVQRSATKKIDALNEIIQHGKEREQYLLAENKNLLDQKQKAEAQSKEFQKAAEVAQQAADSASARARVLAQKLKQMAKPKPPTDPNDLPADQAGLIKAFQLEGFEPFPIANPQSIAFAPENAKLILALTRDGKAYPDLLNRSLILEDQIDALNTANQQQSVVIANLDAALKSEQTANKAIEAAYDNCEERNKILKEMVGKLEEKVKLTEKKLNAESWKKWLTGIGGGLLGLLLHVL